MTRVIEKFCTRNIISQNFHSIILPSDKFSRPRSILL